VRWAKAVRPRRIVLENVEEFQTWGPLVNERPDPARRGRTFKMFVGRLRALGYVVEWRELRACDYGAPTIRKRLFLIARCDGEKIVWPTPTHGKGRALPWRTAAECIDFDRECPSIFTRKKPLAENTLKRIAAGLRRFVFEADRPFIIGVGGRMGQSAPRSLSQPYQTITTKADAAIVQPMPTVVPTQNGASLVAGFLAKHYGGHETPGAQLGLPISTLTTQDHHHLVASSLVKLSQNSVGQSVERPLDTVMPGATRFAEVRAFLIAYYGQEKDGGSLFDPMRTLSTRDRFGLVTVEGVDYQLADIGMRMLAPRELYRAQGFPDSYRIDIEFRGKPLSKTAQVRMCGNSVCPDVAAAIIRANVPGVSAGEAAA